MRIRRGIALLLTVLTMTVLIVAVSIIARSRTTEALVASQAHRQVLADDLLQAAQVPIRRWLEEKASGGIVLPSSASAPMTPVLDQTLRIGEIDAQIRVTAWDQQGMWPGNAREIGLRDGPGLVLPKAMTIAGLDAGTGSTKVVPASDHPDAPGGLVATHNPWPTRSGTTRSRAGAVVNVNTVPAPLLGQIYSLFNLGDPGEILDQRDRGQLAIVSLTSSDTRQMPIRLVSISRVWSLRIDARVGPLRRSCWCVYINQGGRWNLSQRFVIHED